MKTARRLKIPLTLLVVFWMIAIVFWQIKDNSFYLFNIGYLGTALGLGLGAYELLPRKKIHLGRRLAQFLMGVCMLFFLGFILNENMQIEGIFFYLLAGFFSGSVIHFLVAKLAGPLIFSRGWRGWSYWTVMLLDLLLYKRNKPGRLAHKWEYLRYAHFTISLGLVLILYFGFNYRVDGTGKVGLYWLIGGNALYYLIGIILAYKLQDNSAICKYVCPIPILQKIPSSFALLKIAGSPEKCNDCSACSKICPMDIQISSYSQSNQRVLSTECI
jgi:polyferredoxin